MFSSIPGFYPTEARSLPAPSVLITKNVSRNSQMTPEWGEVVTTASVMANNLENAQLLQIQLVILEYF